ncbi:hypothetical protein KSS87_006498 [Heliosperma pusillum]|nr:hypothetical protein KSS87_006498 [Heliosperma pusillum]
MAYCIGTTLGHAKAFNSRNGVMVNTKKRATPPSSFGNFQHLFGAVQKDWDFLKKGIVKGFDWANQVLPTPTPPSTTPDNKFMNTLNHFVWLPLSGMDLLLADVEALATYANYFYSMSKLWSRPLPELYDEQQISDYFNCRPHVIALRFLEVFFTFSSAVIKLRASRMRRLLISGTDVEIGESTSEYDFGKVLKDSFLSLGPTFIKVGQSLSTRPDIVGPEISKALSELHDQIPPFPTAIAMKIIEQELGAPTSRFFSYISEEPVAAASFGQVYRGTTCDGCAVAIKVQRPNLHHLVARDIYILRLGLGLLQKIARRKNDIRLYADELGKGLMGELDYRLEAENALRFLEAHSSFTFIHVPKVFRHLTRKRILTMDWVVGENPNDLLLVSTGATYDGYPVHAERQKLEAKRRLLDLVSKGVEASLIQLLETGFLHADPHPGNLRYTTSGQIGFLDFGLMCQMERKHQLAMLASIIHIVNGDWASLVQALSEMDVVKPGTNTRLVTVVSLNMVYVRGVSYDRGRGNRPRLAVAVIAELENSLGEVEFNDGIPDVKFSKIRAYVWTMLLGMTNTNDMLQCRRAIRTTSYHQPVRSFFNEASKPQDLDFISLKCGCFHMCCSWKNLVCGPEVPFSHAPILYAPVAFSSFPRRSLSTYNIPSYSASQPHPAFRHCGAKGVVVGFANEGVGLAIAADENFKTFEAAYPYVVRKLLTDNSDASKKILHSNHHNNNRKQPEATHQFVPAPPHSAVLLDRRREFQWKRLALFLRVGAARKSIPGAAESAAADGTLKSSSVTAENFDVAAFVLRLLPSKDGIVLRRLLVTADGSSLVRAFLSEEAAPVRQQLCRAIADVLNQWMLSVSVKGISVISPSQSFASTRNYQLLLRDRRLKVVLGKILNDARKDWSLTLRFYWVSVGMLITAFAMAFHRSMVSASEAYFARTSRTPMRVMA